MGTSAASEPLNMSYDLLVVSPALAPLKMVALTTDLLNDLLNRYYTY